MGEPGTSEQVRDCGEIAIQEIFPRNPRRCTEQDLAQAGECRHRCHDIGLNLECGVHHGRNPARLLHARFGSRPVQGNGMTQGRQRLLLLCETEFMGTLERGDIHGRGHAHDQ